MRRGRRGRQSVGRLHVSVASSHPARRARSCRRCGARWPRRSASAPAALRRAGSARSPRCCRRPCREVFSRCGPRRCRAAWGACGVGGDRLRYSRQAGRMSRRQIAPVDQRPGRRGRDLFRLRLFVTFERSALQVVHLVAGSHSGIGRAEGKRIIVAASGVTGVRVRPSARGRSPKSRRTLNPSRTGRMIILGPDKCLISSSRLLGWRTTLPLSLLQGSYQKTRILGSPVPLPPIPGAPD